jgi:DnaK suppressor protein
MARIAREQAELRAEELERLKGRLLEERRKVLMRMSGHVREAIEDQTVPPDEMDVASQFQEQAFLLRLADKERKLLLEIDNALCKFSDGSYGFCEGTGEPIGYRRLEARPWTRYSVAYKEQLEREGRR